MRALPRLHLVTDDATLARDEFLADARTVLEAGGARVALHLRGPGTAGRRHWKLARELEEAAEAAGALLVINDRVDVALALDLPAVQLGARSLPPGDARTLLGSGALVGSSVHDSEEAAAAVDTGADFLVLGTVYATPSHPGREGGGPELVRRVSTRVAPAPVVAIGGVIPERLPEILRAGGHGAAVLRGVWRAPAPAEAVKAYLRELPSNRNGPSLV